MLWAQKPYQILRHNNQTWSVMLCWTTIAGDTVGESENTSKAKFTNKHLQPWRGHCDRSLQLTLSFKEYTVLNLKGKTRNPFTPQHVLVLQSNKRKSSQGQHQRTTFQTVKLILAQFPLVKKHQLSFVHTCNLGNITSIRPIPTSKVEGGRVNTFGPKD